MFPFCKKKRALERVVVPVSLNVIDFLSLNCTPSDDLNGNVTLYLFYHEFYKIVT